MREPDKILAGAARTLDFSQPIALMMLGILGQIPDSDDPGAIIKRLMEPMTSGSYLAISDGVNTSETLNEASRQLNESAHNAYHLRTPEQITGFFDGLDLVVAEAGARFHAPAHFDDELEISLEIERLGNTSMVSAIAIRRGGDTLVNGRVVHIFVVAERLGEKTPIPEHVREALRPFSLEEPSSAPTSGELARP